jgi:hypothetical protein
MNTGILAATWLCMAVGQAQSTPETIYVKSREHHIPVNLSPTLRANLREMLLFASSDQGRTWPQVDRITPEKGGFSFYAPKDGVYWLRVAQVTKAGVQTPADKLMLLGPPDMIMVVDTMQPIIRSFDVQRDGEDVYVKWDVQEDNPDRNGLSILYQVKDSFEGKWTAVPLQAPSLQGQTKFRPATREPLIVRLTVRDLAKNESYAPREVAGLVAAASYNPPAVAPQSVAPTPTLPVEIPLPQKPIEPMNPVPMMPAPPAPTNPLTHKVQSSGPVGLVAPPAFVEATEKVIADSRIPPQPEPAKVLPTVPQPVPGAGSLAPPPLDAAFSSKPTAPPPRKLPELTHVKGHQVTLQYELKRVGPSGVGGLQIWLTKDDGQTWEPHSEDPKVQSDMSIGRQEKIFDLCDEHLTPYPDGVYGLILVVKNRAGLGRTPKAGDVPEIRVEIDTKAPIAQLYKPMPDPQRPDHVLLKWFADDKNLHERPITLEYAEKRDGPWLPIQTDLENRGSHTNKQISGDFSWKVPANFPVQVYLRLRVRDKAGNESVAVSSAPEYLDLTEPEGALIGVQAK